MIPTLDYAVIVAGGVLSDPAQLKVHAEGAGMVIAADSGADLLFSVGVPPQSVVGDMDSITPDSYARCLAMGITLEEHPPEKDETDLQLALTRAVEAGFKTIHLFAVLGGRLDHTLGNLSLLEGMAKNGCTCIALDGAVEVRCISEKGVLEGNSGDLLSLIPLDNCVEGITTDGLLYALCQARLIRGGLPSGVSNVFTSSRVVVTINGSGALLAVHTRV